MEKMTNRRQFKSCLCLQSTYFWTLLLPSSLCSCCHEFASTQHTPAVYSNSSSWVGKAGEEEAASRIRQTEAKAAFINVISLTHGLNKARWG